MLVLDVVEEGEGRVGEGADLCTRWLIYSDASRICLVRSTLFFCVCHEDAGMLFVSSFLLQCQRCLYRAKQCVMP